MASRSWYSRVTCFDVLVDIRAFRKPQDVEARSSGRDLVIGMGWSHCFLYVFALTGKHCPAMWLKNHFSRLII